MHLSDRKRSTRFLAKRGQERFGDEVEIYRAAKQPLSYISEVCLKSRADEARLFLGAVVEPIALNRVDNSDLDYRLSASQRGIQPCKMVFNVGVFLMPGGLIMYRCRVVALGVAVHRYPREMRHSDGNSDSRLPISVKLVSAEVKIPARNSVKLAEHSRAAVLSHRRLTLLCGCELKEAAEHIYTRYSKRAVGSHDLACVARLIVERGFCHHVSRKRDAVPLAPLAASVGEGFNEAIANVIVVAVACKRRRAVGKIPNKLWEMRKYRLAVFCAIGLVKIVCPGESYLSFAIRVGQRAFARELRLVGKHRVDGLAEFVAYSLFVGGVGNVNKPFGRFGVERVKVRLPVIPRRVSRYLADNSPRISLRRLALSKQMI